MKGDFHTVPGDCLVQTTRHGEHRYRCVAITAYRDLAGRARVVVQWRGVCAGCGASFSLATPRKPPRFLTRRCEACRNRVRQLEVLP
jgi:hypothetical protein